MIFRRSEKLFDFLFFVTVYLKMFIRRKGFGKMWYRLSHLRLVPFKGGQSRGSGFCVSGGGKSLN